MNEKEKMITVKILNRAYHVKCPNEEAFELQAAARYLDDQMRKLQKSKTMSNPDQVAVVAALNITCELMTLKKQKNNYIDHMSQRIAALQDQIQKFLDEKEEIAV